MYESDRPLILLYLVNVLQPVPRARLRKEYETLSQVNITLSGFNQMLEQLVRTGFVLKKKRLYSVSGSGLQRVSAFGLARIRDRNRLFLIKKLL